jgi:hypothetical protein
MVSIKSLVVLSAFVASAVAFAADGTSSFRLSSGRIASFDYSADFQAGKITGSLERNGYNKVELTASRGGWTGAFGMGGINVAPIQTTGENQVVEISTMEGFFHYTLSKDGKGGLEIRAMGKNGDFLGAYLSAEGSLSVDSPIMSFEVTRDQKHPTHFEGTAVIDFLDLEMDSADMDADGSLDPNALAKADPALFIILYVLPFHLGN